MWDSRAVNCQGTAWLRKAQPHQSALRVSALRENWHEITPKVMRLKTPKLFLWRKSSFILSWSQEEKGQNKTWEMTIWGTRVGFWCSGVRARWIKKQNICIDSAEVEMNASCSAHISGVPVCSSWGKRCPDQWPSIRAASDRTDYRARHPIRPDSQVVLNIRPLFLCWLKTHEFHRTTAGNWGPEKKGVGNMQHSVIMYWWYSEESFWYFQLKH